MSFSRLNNKMLYRQYPSEFNSYRMAKTRCQCPNYPSYYLYGGRGIEFRFTSFDQFFDVLGPKPSAKHQVDRKDNNGHYEPGNVRWATKKEQADNRSTNRYITHNGERLNISQWAARIGLPQNLLYARLNVNKWCEGCTLTLPKSGRCPHKVSDLADVVTAQ